MTPRGKLALGGSWWRHGPPSVIVWPCRLDVSTYAALGRGVPVPRVACPHCGGATGAWSGYLRHLRDDCCDHYGPREQRKAAPAHVGGDRHEVRTLVAHEVRSISPTRAARLP